MTDTAKTDRVTQLLNAADNIDDLTRSQLQVLLRQAALDIRTLRELVSIRDDIVLEGIEPEDTPNPAGQP